METIYMSDGDSVTVPMPDIVSVPRMEYIDLLRKAAIMDILAANRFRSWETESFIKAAIKALYPTSESGDDGAE